MRVLGWVLTVVLVIATAAWFAAAYLVKWATANALNDLRENGYKAEVAEIGVGGFPAALRLDLDQIRFADPAGGIGWQAPGLSIAAASWAPWHLTATLPPTQAVTVTGLDLTLTSDRATLVLASAPDLAFPLSEAGLTGDRLSVAADAGWTVSLGEFFVRLLPDTTRAPGAYDLTFDLAPLTPDPALARALAEVSLPDLPPPDFPEAIESLYGEVGLTYGAPLQFAGGDAAAELEEIRIDGINFGWGALALRAEGLLAADAEGFAAGRVQLELTNWDRLPALLVATGAITPELAPSIGNGLRAMAAESPDPAVLSLPLDMGEGRMSLGPFPLGEAPRLRAPRA